MHPASGTPLAPQSDADLLTEDVAAPSLDPPPDSYFLTGEVARIFKVSPETVRLWERKGLLPAIKTTGGVRLFGQRGVLRRQRERQGTAA